jgi:8-oxo-dGTP diphosphatase
VSDDGRVHPSRPVVSVGAVVIDGPRVLLVKRGQPPLMNQWSLPGGRVELGERLEAALVREVREETGLDVLAGAVIEVLDRIEYGSDGRIDYHYVIIDYVCRLAGGTLAAATDAADARWVPTSEFDAYQLTAKVREVIAKAFAMVSG